MDDVAALIGLVTNGVDFRTIIIIVYILFILIDK